MRSLILILLASLIIPAICGGQIKFNKIFSDSISCSLNSIVEIQDGYILCGQTNRNGKNAVKFIKLDLTGTQIWEKYLENDTINYYTGWANSFFSIQQGGYALAGSYSSTSIDDVSLLVIFDQNCDTIFTKKYTIQGCINSSFHGTQKSDGGFLLTGELVNLISNPIEVDMLLISTDSLGNMIWYEKYGGDSQEYGSVVCESNNNNYLVGGTTYSFSSSNFPGDWYLISTDSLGTMNWERTYGTNDFSDGTINEILKTNDGNHIITGLNTYSFDILEDYADYRGRIIKLDNQGSTIWDKTYSVFVDFHEPLDSSCSQFLGVTEATNGNIASICRIRRLDNTQYSKLFLFNSSGDTIYTSYTHCPDTNVVFDMEEMRIIKSTNDGGFIMGGVVSSPYEAEQMWVLKTDCNGFYDLPSSEFSYSINQLEVSFANLSSNADSCYWDYGDGSELISASVFENLAHNFSSAGAYDVSLIVYSSCSPSIQDTITVAIEIPVAGLEIINRESNMALFPNPTMDIVNIETGSSELKHMVLYDLLGNQLINESFIDEVKSLNLSRLSSGVYIIKIKNQHDFLVTKLIKR